MDIKKIKKIIKLLENSNLSEIEIKNDKELIRLVKKKSTTKNIKNIKKNKTKNKNKNEEIITSPISGIFYSSPSPEKDPFIKIGQIIRKNQPLCIIETMKTFNTIKSETNGIIKKILINNKQKIDINQTLFIIEK